MDLVTSSAGKRKYKDKFSNKHDQKHCHCGQFVFNGLTDATLTNYAYSEDILDNKAPYHHDQNYGAAAVAGSSLTVAQIFRMGSSYIPHRDIEVKSIYGWFTVNDADGTASSTVTLAVCKASFVENDATAVEPVVLGEFSITGLDSNSKLIKLDSKAFTQTKVTKQDIIFTMIKSTNADDDVYWKTVVEYK
jgi:hypothetical protein